MALTIKQKLVALGILALLALSCASTVSVLSGMQINKFNDMARVTQSNKVMTTRMIMYRQTLVGLYYAAVLSRDRGKVPPDLMERIDENTEKMQDMTERLIGRKLPYLDARSIEQALRIGAEMAVISQQDAPRLIASQADDKAVADLTTMMLGKASDLAELQAAFDDAVAEDLSEISDRVKDETDRATRDVGVVFGVALVILTGLLTTIIRSITRPIVGITRVMGALAKGELDVAMPEEVRRDEIGTMVQAVRVFKQNAIENQRLTLAKMTEQAARTSRQNAVDGHVQEFGVSISGVMTGLVQAAAEMRTVATEMSDAAKRTNQSTSGAVRDVNNAAQNLNTVAVAAEQMAASIAEISRQVGQVTQAVTQAVECATATDTKVATMADATNRIGDVVRLITAIARQTDLLALNATIEAARAGEAGKGFAVVASEVKSLAGQTASATELIGTQITAIRGATTEAVSAVQAVGRAIGQVESVATAIATAVEQQASATQEISSNAQSVTQAINEAARAMEVVLAISDSTDILSQSVQTAAGNVGHTAATLRTEVGDFLAAMTRGDVEERRAYERIAGNGATVSLSIPGQRDRQSAVHNISLGGLSAGCDVEISSGTEVKIGFSTGATVVGRVVRWKDGCLSASFRQDPASLEQILRALAVIGQGAGTDGQRQAA